MILTAARFYEQTVQLLVSSCTVISASPYFIGADSSGSTPHTFMETLPLIFPDIGGIGTEVLIWASFVLLCTCKSSNLSSELKLWEAVVWEGYAYIAVCGWGIPVLPNGLWTTLSTSPLDCISDQDNFFSLFCWLQFLHCQHFVTSGMCRIHRQILHDLFSLCRLMLFHFNC